MCRRIIFIGKADTGTIYLDTKSNQILRRKSNAHLDMEGSKNNGFYAAIGTMLVGPIIGLIGFVLELFFNTGDATYTRPILVGLAFIWVLESVGFVLLMEKILYGKKSDPLVPATSSEFHQAFYTNVINCNPKDEAVTGGNKLAVFLTLLFICLPLAILMFFMLLTVGSVFLTQIADFIPEGLRFLGRTFEFQTLILALLAGFMPGCVYTVLFQNNAFRWLLAVEKYKANKLEAADTTASADE